MWRMFGREKRSGLDVESILLSMLKILTEGNSGTLKELLHLCSSCFGDGELSVVSNDGRQVIATTREDVECAREVAFHIKDVTKRFYYFREEVNGMLFLDKINCIRVIPLSPMGGEFTVLVVEQENNVDECSERILDMLSIATRIHLQETRNISVLKKDSLTKLGNRDGLKEHLCELLSEEQSDVYVGIFALRNMPVIGLKEGYIKANDMVCTIASIINRYFVDFTYRINEYKFAIVQCGSVYNIVSRMQDCMDELSNSFPTVNICGVIAPCDTEFYRTMYISEKASDEEVADNTVILIREVDSMFDIREDERLLFLNTKKDKEETIYTTVEYPTAEEE